MERFVLGITFSTYIILLSVLFLNHPKKFSIEKINDGLIITKNGVNFTLSLDSLYFLRLCLASFVPNPKMFGDEKCPFYCHVHPLIVCANKYASLSSAYINGTNTFFTKEQIHAIVYA